MYSCDQVQDVYYVMKQVKIQFVFVADPNYLINEQIKCQIMLLMQLIKIHHHHHQISVFYQIFFFKSSSIDIHYYMHFQEKLTKIKLIFYQ